MTGENGTLDISDWPLFAIDVESSHPFLQELAVNKPSHFVIVLFSLAFDGRITPSGKTVSEVYVPASFDSRDATDVLSTIKALPDSQVDAEVRPRYHAVWNHVLEIIGGVTSDSIEGCSYLREDAGRTELLIATEQDNCQAINRMVRDGANLDAPGLPFTRLQLKEIPDRVALIDFDDLVWAEMTGPDTAPVYQIESVEFVD